MVFAEVTAIGVSAKRVLELDAGPAQVVLVVPPEGGPGLVALPAPLSRGGVSDRSLGMTPPFDEFRVIGAS